MTLRALVTGGISGLGLATAERLRADGTEVVTLDRAPGADVVVDVADDTAVAAAVAELGAIDILINSAGVVGPNQPLWEVLTQDWDRTFAVNVRGTFHMCRAVVPGMRERGWGRIVNISSIAGKDGNPNLSAYSASKAAVIALTKSLGKELANTNVRVNCVTPAAVRTPLFAQMTQEHIDFMLSKIPLGRFGEIDEIASLVCWLASEECSFSTGGVFDISGGRATY